MLMLKKAVENVYNLKPPSCLFKTMSQISNSVCFPQNAESDIESDVNLNQDSATVLEAETVINTHNSSSQVEVSEDLKDLLTDDYCHICEAVLLFESQRASHYEGKKHAQKVRLYLLSKKAENPDKDTTVLQAGTSVDKQKFCELCNMVFSSGVVAKSHYEGKIHAKNLRRFRPLDAKLKVDCAQPYSPQVPDKPEMTEDDTAMVGSKVDSPATTTSATPTTAQEVDLSDPNKHCRLCAATFNNPHMAQQHYSGRKHQRNQSRQQLLQQLSEDGETASSLTCPICSVTFSSVEMYQAHMQGNKHQLKEKKVAELCKSQKKVYDSFQDELADYIAVQKARGLQPKATERGQEHNEDIVKAPPPPPHPPPPPPPPVLPPSLFSIRFPTPPPRSARPPFQPSANRFPSWVRGAPRPPPFWEPGYSQSRPNSVPFARPQGPVGRRPARGRSPDWTSSSSSSGSDSSSSSSSSSNSSSNSSSSSSSSSDSDDSRERRRRRQRKLKDRGRRDREKERRVREGQEERAERRPRRRERRDVEGERNEDHERRRSKQRKERERRHRRGLTDKERDDRKQKRDRKRRRPHEEEEDEEGVKRRREAHEELTMGERENMGGDVREELDEEGGDITYRQGNIALMESFLEDRREKHKHRHKKERKKRERTEEVDTRTEEEKLWDETILGTL